MTSLFKKHGQVIFSVIGALIIMGAAWWTKGAENTDTWLYVFSIWLILFSAFDVYSSVKIAKLARIALASLVGASAIIIAVWWVNGAENVEVFLTSAAGMLVAFFVLASHKKQGGNQ